MKFYCGIFYNQPVRSRIAFLSICIGLVLALLAFTRIASAAPQLGGAAAPSAQSSQDGQALFQAKCAGCHTIGGGKLVGPDLKDVTSRRDAQWLKKFITNPNDMLDSDPTAMDLLKQFGMRMPVLGLSAAEVDALITYLSGPGGAAGGPAAGVPNGNPAVGKSLFEGNLGLANGGTACMACHTVSGVGSLGGGSLGPDLTHVVGRMGAAGLASSLGAIAFPTMIGPFANHPLTPSEQADIVAFLQQSDRQTSVSPVVAPGMWTANAWLVFSIGLAGTSVLFIVLLFFWPRQTRSISRQLRAGEAARLARRAKSNGGLQ